MEDKNTLFAFLHENLREQITTGRLLHGTKLPSMSQLCELYHVGMRTVRDVLRTLKNEGYIQTEERKPAVVIYQPTEAGKQTAIRFVLSTKTSLLSVYETMSVLMPPLFCLCARHCGDDMRSDWAAALRKAEKKPPQARWKVCTAFLYSLLDTSGNLLLRDLFASLEIYARLPYFQNQADFIRLVTSEAEFRGTLWVMESLLTQDQAEVSRRFRIMYRSVTAAIETYLSAWSRIFPNVPENPKKDYAWTSERGRGHFYTQLARDLIDKIGLGIYKPGVFLPSEAALARQYGVCVSTVRKAMSMLNTLGFGKTYNARGTQVVLQDEQSTVKVLRDKTYKRDTMLYLSGLQLMAAAIRPAAVLAFPGIDACARQALSLEIAAPDAIPLDCLVDCVLAHLPLKPLKSILTEVHRLLLWGYYFAFFPSGRQSGNPLRTKARQALAFLEDGDAEGFAAQLSACYCHILTFVRDAMVQFGLTEAAGIKTPDSC